MAKRSEVDLHIALPRELHAALDVLAQREDRPLAGVVRQLVREELARRGIAVVREDREREPRRDVGVR